MPTVGTGAYGAIGQSAAPPRSLYRPLQILSRMPEPAIPRSPGFNSSWCAFATIGYPLPPPPTRPTPRSLVRATIPTAGLGKRTTLLPSVSLLPHSSPALVPLRGSVPWTSRPDVLRKPRPNGATSTSISDALQLVCVQRWLLVVLVDLAKTAVGDF